MFALQVKTASACSVWRLFCEFSKQS